MSNNNKKWFSLNLSNKKQTDHSCGCGKTSGGCHSHKEMSNEEFLSAAVEASVGEVPKRWFSTADLMYKWIVVQHLKN